MKHIRFLIILTGALLLATAMGGRAATLSVLYTFGVLTNVTGLNPQAPLTQGPGGALYGTARTGEGMVRGVVFRMRPDGTGFTWLKLFTYTNENDGQYPEAGLILSGNMLYGTTESGGSNGMGTVFALTTNGTGFSVLHTFTATNSVTGMNLDGAVPVAGMVLSAGVLYGTTSLGGTNGSGTVFSMNTDGTGFKSLHAFAPIAGIGYTNSDGANPSADLILSGNRLYGTARYGGTNSGGTVFALNTDGSAFTNLLYMNGGALASYGPAAGLILSGNMLYGTSTIGGTDSQGSVFGITTNGTGYVLVHSFTFNDGSNPLGDLVLSGGVLYGTTALGGGNGGGGTVFRVNVDGTGFTNLYNFRNAIGSSGSFPEAGLVLFNGTLYGTAYGGGTGANGILFAVGTNGTGYTNLVNFGYSTAAYPAPAMVLSGNRFYGSTETGGAGYGTVFALNTDGTGYTNLHNFTDLDGVDPQSLLRSGGTLFGTTHTGGVANKGTIFGMGTNGLGFTNLFNFLTTKGTFSTNGTGADPDGILVLSGDVLYGTAPKGGANGSGTVYSILTNGTSFNLLYSFTPTNSVTGTNIDGAEPQAGLILSGSTLYGMAWRGGSNGFGSVYNINASGSGFTDLHSFTGVDGANPATELLQSGNRLYGTTAFGGLGSGTVFAMNSDGSDFTVLHTFSATNSAPNLLFPTNSDGAAPYAKLVLAGGTLYGTTTIGGSLGYGTIFAVGTNGMNFRTLFNFGFTNGFFPSASLLSGNTLYGTTVQGGPVGDGVVFALSLSPALNIQLLGGKAVLTWDDPAFSLQSATNVQAPYTTIVGAGNPYTNSITGPTEFFRLQGN